MKPSNFISKVTVCNFNTKKKYITIGIFTVLSLWSFPVGLLHMPGPGGESSWEVGIQWAHFKGLHFGKDIVWDYGPLGHLIYPMPIEKNYWFEGVLYKVISHFLLWSIVALFAFKSKMSIRQTIIFASIAFLFVKSVDPTSPVLIGLMLSYYLILKFKSNGYYYIIPVSFAAAFLSFVKFDLPIASVGLTIVFALFLLKQKRWRELLTYFFSYSIILVLIWMMVGEPLNNLLPFLSTSWDISTGYTAGLSTNQLDTVIAPLAIAGWLLVLSTIVMQKFRLRNAELFFLSLVLLFVFFKHGVVRDDVGHVRDFILGWPLLLYPYYSFLNGNRNFSILRSAAFVMVGLFLLAFCFVLSTIDTYPGINPKLDTFLAYSKTIIVEPGPLSAFSEYVQFYFSNPEFTAIKDQFHKMLSPQSPLSNSTLNLISNNTVDIFPQAIDLLYYYNMNWSPRPVIQSLVAYTDKLDTLNSIHFSNETSSPKFILYGVGTVDNRNPFYDEPATLRAILCNYKTIGTDTYLNILQKSSNECTSQNLISSQVAQFDQTMKVPTRNNSDLLFAKIFIHYNALGKISDTLYKPPPIQITLNNQYQYRFIYQNAPNGILLDASNNVRTIFPWMGGYSVSSLKFSTDTRFYDDKIEIEFFTMNYTNKK